MLCVQSRASALTCMSYFHRMTAVDLFYSTEYKNASIRSVSDVSRSGSQSAYTRTCDMLTSLTTL